PQISEGGTVKLSIAQEVSSVSKTPVAGSAGITTTVRSIATNVLVEDGQIIALGGLIRDDTSGAEEKVPFLGDIPFLGNLFKYNKKNRQKVNLMVFLRPTIIRNAEDSKNVSLDRYDYLRTQYLRSMENETDIPFLRLEKGKLAIPVEPVAADKNKLAKKEGQ
ncbi:type II secretion system protein GspD, partial [Undibacterium sp.]|uniref:type II secretion system protein GspD n=1 Tax=Undibacterium sp. TaxID=1914977 RepID=UPI0037521382